MNKKKQIIRGSISLLLGVSMLIAFVILGNKNWQETEKKDAEKFSDIYVNIPNDNVFVLKTLKEINKILESGNGIVFFCFPSNDKCEVYAKYVNEVAKEMDIKEIYYTDIYYDLETKSIDYQKTLKLLSSNLPYDDKSERRIFVPDLTIVKDGVIVNHNNETATMFSSEESSMEDYWSIEKITEFKNNLKIMFQNLETEDICSTVECD